VTRSLYLCAALILGTPALAGSTLQADRAGLGESDKSQDLWSVAVEGGVSMWLNDPPLIGTQGVTGRLGVGKGIELRLQLPDILADVGGDTNNLYSGRPFVGVKWAYAQNPEIGISIVPSLGLPDLNGDGGFLLRVSANGLFDREKYDLWTNITIDIGNPDIVATTSSFAIMLGGGAKIQAGPLAPFVHGAYVVESDVIMCGIGTGVPAGPSVQFDIGLDLWITSTIQPNVYIGSSVAF
jgi:hypothetical protein